MTRTKTGKLLAAGGAVSCAAVAVPLGTPAAAAAPTIGRTPKFISRER